MYFLILLSFTLDEKMTKDKEVAFKNMLMMMMKMMTMKCLKRLRLHSELQFKINVLTMMATKKK